VFNRLSIISNIDPEHKTIIATKMLEQRQELIMYLNNITYLIVWITFIPIILFPFYLKEKRT